MPAALELSDLSSADGTVRNLSPSGVLIEGASVAVGPGAELGLRLSLPPDSSCERFEVRVVRVTGDGFAARFQRLTSNQIHALWLALLEHNAAIGRPGCRADRESAEPGGQSLDAPSVE